MSDSEQIVAIIRYPKSFDINRLNGIEVNFPNTGKLVLKQKDREEMIEIAELEEDLESNILPKFRLLEKSKSDRRFKLSELRVSKILKLRKCLPRNVVKRPQNEGQEKPVVDAKSGDKPAKVAKRKQSGAN